MCVNEQVSNMLPNLLSLIPSQETTASYFLPRH